MASAPQVQWQEVQNDLNRSGQPIQQVQFAQYVLNVGAMQGGAINLAGAGKQAADRIRPLPTPPHILPRGVSGFLDREQEQRAVGEALARGQVIDLHGPDGMGKTSVISQAMYSLLPRAFPDGMVYLSARHETREDLLQALFESFFETGEDHVKVTENDVRRCMAGKRALIAVDDANHLEEGEAEALAQVVPQCALLVAGREQQVWQGVGVLLGGLPREQAVTLFERCWGQVSVDEQPTIEAICEALGDVPLAIVKTASAAAKRHGSLPQMLQEIQPRVEPRNPIGQTVVVLGRLLSEGERQVLGGLAAPGGATVDIVALEYITQLPSDKLGSYLARLQRMELVHAEDHRYSLDDGIRPYIRQVGVDEQMQRRAAEYYRQRAGDLRGQSPDPDEENVMAALGYYYQRKQWKQVVEIVRAVEPYLVTTGRWGQWSKRLHQAWQAGRELGDRATEAWAQNQLGVVALSLADTAAAANFFRGALSIWQALGDRAGMTIAHWNLQVLLGPPPPPPHKARPPTRPAGGGSTLPIVLAATATVLTIILGILIVVVFWPHPPPPPPPPSPAVDLRLATGCDQTYMPGSVTTIQVQANVDGQVDVYQVNPQGVRAFQFSEEVQSGRVASRDWKAPDGEGRWALEADLNDGQAHARCGFVVEQPTVPQVQISLDKGCEQEYEPGCPAQVSFGASVDGQVAVWLDGQERLFQRDVLGGQTYVEPWQVVEKTGKHRLTAVLGDQLASRECWFSVQYHPPPAPTPLEPNNAEISCYTGAVSVTLRWEPVTGSCGIVRYDVQVVETPGYADYYYSPTTSTLQIEGSQSQAVISGKCGYDYAWRVRTVESVGNIGDWSWTARFRVLTVSESDQTPPPVPQAKGPGSKDSAYPEDLYPCAQVVLAWGSVSDLSGLQGYRVNLQQYNTVSKEWESNEPYFIVTATSIDVAEWLSTGNDYRWSVWAIDNAGNQGDASPWLYFMCPIG